MTVVIHHNPGCGTPPQRAGDHRGCGLRPAGIKRLNTGWTCPQLLAADLTPRAALRDKGTPAAELGLLEPGVGAERLLDGMVAHPILVNPEREPADDQQCRWQKDRDQRDPRAGQPVGGASMTAPR